MIPFEALIDWPPLPESGFVSGRVATPVDLDEGAAAFLFPDREDFLSTPGPDFVSSGEPADLRIPQYVLWVPIGVGLASPAVLIQAQTDDVYAASTASITFGLRLTDGTLKTASEAETVLLGTDYDSLQGKSVAELLRTQGAHWVKQRIDLQRLLEGPNAQWQSKSPRPRCQQLPVLDLRGRRYAAVAARVGFWLSRIAFDGNCLGLPGMPLAHRVIDIVEYPQSSERDFRFTGYSLADALIERENLLASEQAIFDVWFNSGYVQDTIPHAEAALKLLSPDFMLMDKHMALYSGLEAFLRNCGLERAPAEQWLGTLKNEARISATEVAWSGLPEYLATCSGQVGRLQLLDALDLGALRVRACQLMRWDDRKSPCFSAGSEHLFQYEDDDKIREDGTRNFAKAWEFGLVRGWIYGDDARLWTRSGSENRGYEEWCLLADDDIVYVEGTHFRKQRNAIAHLRTTVRTCTDGTRMLCIDEAQAEWPSVLKQPAGRLLPDTPYRQRWMDLAVRVALLVAARKDIRRIGWMTGKIAQELHVQGPAPQLFLLYDQLLPKAMRRVLGCTQAEFGECAVPTFTRDWQLRQEREAYVFYHHGQRRDDLRCALKDGHTELAKRAQPVDEPLPCVTLDEKTLQHLKTMGLPWMGAPDWQGKNAIDWETISDGRKPLFRTPVPLCQPVEPRFPLRRNAGRYARLAIEVKLGQTNMYHAKSPFSIFWEVRIDGVLWRGTIDPLQLVRSTVKGGSFWIFTCSCGSPGCDGVDNPVFVLHKEKQVRWDFMSPHVVESGKPWQTIAFRRQDYRASIAQALARTRELLSRYPEAGSSVKYEYWDSVVDLDPFSVALPSSVHLPEGVKRLDIGWFWPKGQDEPYSSDFLVDGKSAWIPDCFPLRAVYAPWMSWRENYFVAEYEDEPADHPPRRKGQRFAEANRSGLRLAQAIARCVPKGVAVWFYPVGKHPVQTKLVLSKAHAFLRAHRLN